MAITEKAVVTEIEWLLNGGHAHATLEDAVKGFPVELRGKVVKGLPYSGWQILEHLRITQKDMLEFSDNADGSYKEMKWPDAYWPKDAEPPSETAWDEALQEIHADRKKFLKLLDDAKDLTTPFQWGDGQNLLKEALQIADHNAYHIGELVVVRRLLGCWK